MTDRALHINRMTGEVIASGGPYLAPKPFGTISAGSLSLGYVLLAWQSPEGRISVSGEPEHAWQQMAHGLRELYGVSLVGFI